MNEERQAFPAKDTETLVREYQSAFNKTLAMRRDFSTKRGYIRAKEPHEIALQKAKKVFGEFNIYDKDAMKANTNDGKGVDISMPDGTKLHLHNQRELYTRVVDFNKERGSFYDEKVIARESDKDLKRLQASRDDLKQGKKALSDVFTNPGDLDKAIKRIEAAVRDEAKERKSKNIASAEPAVTHTNPAAKKRDEMLLVAKNTASTEPAAVHTNPAPKKHSEMPRLVEHEVYEEIAEIPNNTRAPKEEKSNAVISNISKHIRFAKQARHVIDDEDLTRRYIILKGRSCNILSPGIDPDSPAIIQHHKHGTTSKIVALNQSEQTAKDVVKLAKIADWKVIAVRGGKLFKQRVWAEASFNGLKVKGYTPDDQDIANLRLRQERAEGNADVVIKIKEDFKKTIANDPTLKGESKKNKEQLSATFDEKLDSMASQGKLVASPRIIEVQNRMKRARETARQSPQNAQQAPKATAAMTRKPSSPSVSTPPAPDNRAPQKARKTKNKSAAQTP